MEVAIILTDLDDEPKGHVEQYENLEVIIPLNEARTAKWTMSIHDPMVLELQTMQRCVEIWLYGVLVFRGYLMQPVWDLREGTVEVNCHDVTLKLKNHYHTYHDFVVGNRFNGGYPVNGLGARLLTNSAFTTQRQRGLGFREMPLLFGIDTTSNLAQTAGPYKGKPRPIDLEDPAVVKEGPFAGGPDPFHKNWQGSADALWRVVERGTNVWESLTNLMESVEGFDIEFEPVKGQYQTNLTFAGTTITKDVLPGFWARMNTRIKQGLDRTASNRINHTYGAHNIVWHAGFGRENAEQVVWSPDGAAMRNYATVTYPAGERSPVDGSRLSSRWVESSAVTYGTFHAWESAGERDNKPSLKAKAEYILAAYGVPVNVLDIEPAETKPGVTPGESADAPWLPFHQYFVGDTVTAQAKRGYLGVQIDGRIQQITLSQVGATRRVKAGLQVVPNALVDLDDIAEGF